MRMRTIVGALVIGVVLLSALSACGDDDQSSPPATTPTDDGGTANPTSPALKEGDCPRTPVITGLVKSSPVWGGIVSLRVTVPGGIPESLEAQVFDPASNGWSGGQGGGDRKQEADGTYVIAVTVRPLQGGEDKPFKLRVRAVLDGCPRTGWVESEPFTITNPLADTTWVSDTPTAGTGASQNFQLNGMGGTKTVGPYSFASGTTISHSFTFAKDGTTSETFKFAVASKTAGDAYAGCVFQVSYASTWQIKLVGNRMTLTIAERVPKANATEGSTCTSPTPAQLNITKTPQLYVLNALSNDLSYGIDYLSAALAEGQPITWQYSAPFSIQSSLGSVFSGLSFTEGPDGATAFVSLNNADPYIRK